LSKVCYLLQWSCLPTQTMMTPPPNEW
jgi:hypothetical protein